MHILVPAALAVIAVLLFGFVIFFHELGHFLLAKAMGVKVNEFSLGMGPKLWGFARKDTQYSLRLLPIGGYCAMEGGRGGQRQPGLLQREAGVEADSGGGGRGPVQRGAGLRPDGHRPVPAGGVRHHHHLPVCRGFRPGAGGGPRWGTPSKRLTATPF